MYICWIAFELGFLYFMIVETRNLTLEEISAMFDGTDLKEKIQHAVPAAAEVRTDDLVDEKASA